MCRKKKRVIHPRYHSPCQTPYTALRSLLSVALSSGMVKSNLIIPFISDKVNVQPFRRHCSVISDEGVQFKTARVFNSTAIFIHLKMERKRYNCICCGTATDTIHDYRLQKNKRYSFIW